MQLIFSVGIYIKLAIESLVTMIIHIQVSILMMKVITIMIINYLPRSDSTKYFESGSIYYKIMKNYN